MTTALREVAVPVNPEAERAVLGAVLQSAKAYLQASRYLAPADFHSVVFGEWFALVGEMVDAGEKVEPLAVLQRLRERHGMAGTTSQQAPHRLLADLVTEPWAGVNVEFHAEKVHQLSRARQLLQLTQRLEQAIEEHAYDHDELMSKAANLSLQIEVLAEEIDDGEAIEGLMRWSELWGHYRSESVEWLIPELMVAEDVWMFLATEGGGKSWLTRQFCLACASGIHPLRPDVVMNPVRTLMLDPENAPDMVAFESRQIGGRAARLGNYDDELGRIWLKEDGLNLRDPGQARLLERAIAEHHPQLVVLGSLYKLMKRGNDDWETAAEDVREVLDRLRHRHKVALVIEHHMPKASGGGDRPSSPYGSSVWQRWPSLGHVIDRVGENMYELVEFRRPRLLRDLPAGLIRGGALPWTGIYSREEMEWGMYEDLQRARRARGGRR